MRRIRIHYGNYGFFLNSEDFGKSEKNDNSGTHPYRKRKRRGSDGEGWEPYSAKIEAQGYRRDWLDFMSIGNFGNR